MQLRNWTGEAIKAITESGRCVIVTVVEKNGSAPCEPGSRLIITTNAFTGTIGGGNLEFLAIQQAKKLLVSREKKLLQTYPLGPMVQQCCGGRIRLLFEKMEQRDLAFMHAVAAHPSSHILTSSAPDDVLKFLINSHGDIITQGGIGALPELIHPLGPKAVLRNDWFFEPPQIAEPDVYIFGAGHIGQALCQIIQPLPVSLHLVDPRPEYLNLATLENIRKICTDDAKRLGSFWKSGSHAIIATHSHALDYRWLDAILTANDSRYCGLIGSRTKRARFIKRLRANQISEEQIARLTCPMGVPQITDKSPYAIAISITAQLLQNISSARQTVDNIAGDADLKILEAVL